jgi:predicted metal-dependent hydrolase
MTAAERARVIAAGRDAFNRGEFFLAHEHWERAWLELAGDERRWLQGLIQIAAALHKRARPAVCRRMLGKALRKLGDVPDEVFGLAAGMLARDAAAMRDGDDRELRI